MTTRTRGVMGRGRREHRSRARDMSPTLKPRVKRQDCSSFRSVKCSVEFVRQHLDSLSYRDQRWRNHNAVMQLNELAEPHPVSVLRLRVRAMQALGCPLHLLSDSRVDVHSKPRREPPNCRTV